MDVVHVWRITLTWTCEVFRKRVDAKDAVCRRLKNTVQLGNGFAGGRILYTNIYGIAVLMTTVYYAVDSFVSFRIPPGTNQA